MWIGAGRLVFDFFGNEHARVKHQNLTDFCKEIKRKYNLSAMEVADYDDPERGVLGFAATFPESWHEERVKETLEKMCKEFDETAPARIVSEDLEIFYHGHE
jgi:uncharacterized protein YlxP (DUF503 family)